jgi:hypothetical protein
MTMHSFSRPHYANSTGFSRTASKWCGVLGVFNAAYSIQVFGESRASGAAGEGAPQNTCGKVQPNPRLKLAACGRRLRRNAQGKPSILSASPAGRSLSAIR